MLLGQGHREVGVAQRLRVCISHVMTPPMPRLHRYVQGRRTPRMAQACREVTPLANMRLR